MSKRMIQKDYLEIFGIAIVGGLLLSTRSFSIGEFKSIVSYLLVMHCSVLGLLISYQNHKELLEIYNNPPKILNNNRHEALDKLVKN
ncbi:hypothetical protein HYG86_08115 [Alkalicella caledoniensis]|uniref:Uncharacterized protein n=1 Tax=Alkalicella caledoniensis TaxID=2731377 RepID=A0A7G9W7U1_ALKCA|nr:hypothetical protein [Alkalicella caledoniensis]QNO14753.1 hypothetical protein HYG86_08115 [Alkalicella caledoniensis]